MLQRYMLAHNARLVLVSVGEDLRTAGTCRYTHIPSSLAVGSPR